MLKCFKYIFLASVLALFGVGTMATQSQAVEHPITCEGGVDKEYHFNISRATGNWDILPGLSVDAMMYGGAGDDGTSTAPRIPGPLIDVTEGDRVCVTFTNTMTGAESDTSVHWHGINAPFASNSNDGVPAVGAGFAIGTGETLAYHWTAPPAGTYMYHSHMTPHDQVMKGLYGPIIVRPHGYNESKYAVDQVWMLSEWRVNIGATPPMEENPPAMPHHGHFPNYFTINGKAFDPVCVFTPSSPGCDTHRNHILALNGGDKVRVRVLGAGQFMHTMHMHGRNFKEIARDSVPIPPGHQLVKNTLTVLPGDIVDIEFTAGSTPEDAGIWVFHCHVLYHSTNDHSYPGGLVAAVAIAP